MYDEDFVFAVFFVVSGLFATDGTEKNSFRQVCNSGGKTLDILKIWQFHKAIIISVAR